LPLLNVNIWKTENRVPLLLFAFPLLIAAASTNLLREVVIGLLFLHFPITIAAYIAIGCFFAFLSILPSWFGYLVRRDISKEIARFGEAHPTLFLRTLRRINRSIFLGYGIVTVLYLLNEFYSPAKADFNLLANNPEDSVVTLSALFTWAFVFEDLALISPFPPYTNHAGMARLCVLSSMEDPQSPFVDDAVRYFNRVMRSSGYGFRLRQDASLSIAFFNWPNLRGLTLGRLLAAIEVKSNDEFVHAVADAVNKKPEEILEKRVLIQSWNQLIQTIVAIVALIFTFLAAFPELKAIFGI